MRVYQFISPAVFALSSLLTIRIDAKSIGRNNGWSEKDNYYQKKAWVAKYIDAFMYPANVESLKSFGEDFFTEDVKSWTDVAGQFTGRRIVAEYAFGIWIPTLGGADQFFSFNPYPVSWEFRGLAVTGNHVSVSALYQFASPFLAPNQTVPAVIESRFLFTDDGLIQQYDNTVRSSSWWSFSIQTAAAPYLAATLGYSPSPTEYQTLVIGLLATSICATHQRACNGTNQQYDSYDACLGFVSQLPIGEVWQASLNTITCRSIHQAMAIVDPDDHCPHIGPSGGMACIDRDYASTILTPFFDYSFVPDENSDW